MDEPTHYCGECDGAYAIRAGFASQPAVHCPGCGKRGLMVVTATLGADEYTARVEATDLPALPTLPFYDVVWADGSVSRGLSVPKAKENKASIEAAIEKHMPPDDECEPIIAPKQP